MVDTQGTALHCDQISFRVSHVLNAIKLMLLILD